MYHFWFTVTLISDLVSRISIESGAYLQYSLSQLFQIWCVDASCVGGGLRTIFKVTVTLTSDLVLE